MSDLGGVHPPHRTLTSRQVFPAVAVVVLALSVLLWYPVLSRPPLVRVEGETLWWGIGLLFAAFVCCEIWSLKVEVRRETLLVSVSELPLVLGLMVLPSWSVGAAQLVAGLAVYLWRKDSWYNCALNMSLIAVEAGAGALVLWLAGVTFPTSPVLFLAAAGGVLIGALISAVAVGLSYQLMGSGEPLVRVVGRSMLAAVVIVTFAQVVYVLWRSDPVVGPSLSIALAIVLVALYRNYFSFLRQHTDLTRVYTFGRTVTAITGTEADWQFLVDEVRDQLNATVAVLRLYDDNGTEIRTVAGISTPESRSPVGPAAEDDILLRMAATHGRVHAAADETKDPLVLAALAARSATDVLGLPLRSADRFKGYLEVWDRQSRWGRFREEDLQILETLSVQVSTALDNIGLIQTLRHEAYHDTDTGLLNRHGLTVEAGEWLQADRLGGVLLVQLGVLTEVNNAIGYDRGSQLLVDAGQRLADLAGPLRPVARIEMDRFAVLFARQPEPEIIAIANNLLAEASRQYHLGGIEVDPDPEAGLVLVPHDLTRTVNASSLLQRAEMAMITATETERPGGVQVYRPSMGEVFRRRFQLVTQFRQAIDAGRIVVHYQPKLNLADREVVGAEALVRWMHPEFGLVSPAEFVQAIETTGSIDILLSHVLDQVLGQIGHWSERDLRLGVAVNLSARNLLVPAFAEHVAAALKSHQVDPARLTFEITESSVMAEPEHSLPVLAELADLGVQLSIDDFGTGYSSLAYLRRLPINEIKIDRSFVQGMVTDLGDLAIVRAIIDLGHSLGLRVVAEGVEEEAARDALRLMKCDHIQGFLLSRPLAADRFEAWLTTRTVRTTRPGSPETVLRLTV